MLNLILAVIVDSAQDARSVSLSPRRAFEGSLWMLLYPHASKDWMMQGTRVHSCHI